jgi:uncharacterized membrane protein YphA (DoxX/SURF4 family)
VDALTHGLGLTGVALTANRAAVGVFFAFSGYHKLFNRDRHASLVATLEADHVPLVRVNQWFVPTVEFIGGIAVSIGFFAPVAALLLVAICCVATCVDGLNRIKAEHPIDWADYCDDLLYLPEVLLAVMLIVVIGAGPGGLALT